MTYLVEVVDGRAGRKVENELASRVLSPLVVEDLHHLDELLIGFADDVSVLETEKDTVVSRDRIAAVNCNSPGRCPALASLQGLTLAIQCTLGLDFNHNPHWVPQSDPHELPQCIRHRCGEETRSSLFRQVGEKSSESRRESQIQQSVSNHRQFTPLLGTAGMQTYRSASSMTSTSNSFVLPTPTAFSCLRCLGPTLLLPSKNSSSLPGVPTRISAPVS